MNKRGDSTVESNDSPEIPDRVGDIRHPRPPFGGSMTAVQTDTVIPVYKNKRHGTLLKVRLRSKVATLPQVT